MLARSQPADQRRRMDAAAMRTYPNIAKAWGLRESEAALLLGAPPTTYRRWKADPERATLDIGQRERMSLILGIYKALQILLPRAESADSWLKRPNQSPTFAGRAPLERLLGGQVSDLFVVRQFLDAARG